MVTSRIGAPLVAPVATTIANVAGTPFVTVAGGVIVTVGPVVTLMTTVPDAVPLPAPVPVPCAPTVAVTVACALVVSVVVARPLLSVVATVVPRIPAVVENVTGEPTSALPLTSTTRAVTVAVPPAEETAEGFALTSTL